MTTLILPFFAMISLAIVANGQGMKMGEVILLSNSSFKKDVKPEALEAAISKEIALWNKNKTGAGMHLFKADRGNRKGDLLLVCEAGSHSQRNTLGSGSPFSDRRFNHILNNPASYTEYRLIGADKFNPQPTAGILGIHYIKVKPERSREFEKFVVEKLHPGVGRLLPDMHLMYYKAAAGEHAGSYVTVFAIESVAARDKYWPAGAPETEILKQAFSSLQSLAAELGSYLTEGSYLEPGKGAAAYFESHEWTDFIHQ